MADEREWLRREGTFRAQRGAARRGRERSGSREPGYDLAYRPRESLAERSGRGPFRGRGTQYGADYGHPGLGRGPRSDFFRQHGRSGIQEGRWLDEAARGPGTEDFAGHEHRHYGHTPSDRWPSREAGFSGPMTDADVLEAVRENLFQDSYVDPDRIRVRVERGIVTLRGDVDDFLEARYAWDDAWESPGVRGVINNLTVRTDLPSEQMEMPQTGGRDRSAG